MARHCGVRTGCCETTSIWLLLLLMAAALVRSETALDFYSEALLESTTGDPGLAVARAAEVKAIGWVLSRMGKDYGWGEDTAHTALALALANASWALDPSNMEAQLVTKQFEMELVLRLWKHHEVPLTTGHLALNVLALVALCKDPRAFHTKDLVAMLERQPGVVEFEVAFSELAACSAGRRVRRRGVRRLLDVIASQRKTHSIDTLSVVVLALQCAQQHRRQDLRPYIEEALAMLTASQGSDGAFGGNLHSTALALQSLIASDLSGTWNATLAQEYMMSHQRADGSFGGLFDTNAVLPLLAGRTLLGVADQPCLMQPRHRSTDGYVWQGVPDEDVDHLESHSSAVYQRYKGEPIVVDQSRTTAAPPLMNVTYVIWKGNTAQESYNLTLTVPTNTSFYSIMQAAAEKDDRFEFVASRWSNGYYIHTIGGQREQKVGYWFWLLYRLRKPPVPAAKPDNKFIVGTGVLETFPSDGDYMLFWYHKI